MEQINLQIPQGRIVDGESRWVVMDFAMLDFGGGRDGTEEYSDAGRRLR